MRTSCCLSCGLHKLSFLVVFTSCLFLLSSHVVFALCLCTLSSQLSSHTQFSLPLCCCCRCCCCCCCCCRYCRTFEGSWNTDPEIAITAGGPLRSKKSKRGNPRWTQNPQYVHVDVVDVVDVGCTRLYSVVVFCCTRLYSVVFGCTRNFQYRCNYPKTESLWASFFEQCFW